MCIEDAPTLRPTIAGWPNYYPTTCTLVYYHKRVITITTTDYYYHGISKYYYYYNCLFIYYPCVLWVILYFLISKLKLFT